MEKKFIDNQDYWSLYELLKDMHPYNLTNDFAVYSYCRSMCRLPLMAEEYKRITEQEQVRTNFWHNFLNAPHPLADPNNRNPFFPR